MVMVMVMMMMMMTTTTTMTLHRPEIASGETGGGPGGIEARPVRVGSSWKVSGFNNGPGACLFLAKARATSASTC